MKPKKHSSRDGLRVVNVDGKPDNSFMDSFLEDGETGFVDDLEPDGMNDQELRIEALKRAIDIAKLMSDITTEDVISIASTVADYIRNTQI